MSLMRESVKVRRFDAAKDFPAYVELLNKTAQQDGGNLTTEQEQLDFATLFTINLDTDRWVIENPIQGDQFIAVCDVWQISKNLSAELMLLVHQNWRHQGIGSHLLAFGFQHAKELNVTAIDAYAQPEQKVIQAFLEHNGFEIAGNYTSMEATVTTPFPKTSLTANYKICTYANLEVTETQKLELILIAGNEFWGKLWGHKVSTDIETGRQAIRDNVLNKHSEDALFFLYDGETHIGHDRVSFSETSEGIKVGHCGVPALHPAWHTPELARAFALVGLEWLYAQGCRQFAFSSWGERKETLQAFEILGFRTNFFEIGYQFVLPTV